MIVTLFSISFASTVQGFKEDKYKLVSVEYGDTLWGIAEENCNRDQDIRELIFKIREINNLKSSDIYLGSRLRIPIG
jgi:LysM repeat protein